MSIPFLFTPMSIDGRRVFDGGLRNNFPLKKFLDNFPGEPFIAVYLGKPENQNKKLLASELLDIVVDGEERELVDKRANDVVIIDTSPIRTTDFRLTRDEKEFLLAVGKASALEFLHRRGIDGGPSLAELEAAREIADSKRTLVIQRRAVRHSKQLWIAVFAFVGIVLLFWSAKWLYF